MRVVAVVSGHWYEKMFDLIYPMYKKYWGVNLEAIVPEVIDNIYSHWSNTKVLALLQPGPLMLVDTDVLPIGKPDWDSLNKHTRLAAVYKSSMFNTGCVYVPPSLSESVKRRLRIVSGTTFTGPLWEQSSLQTLISETLDPRWADLSKNIPTDSWGIHVARARTAESKIEYMRQIIANRDLYAN